LSGISSIASPAGRRLKNKARCEKTFLIRRLMSQAKVRCDSVRSSSVADGCVRRVEADTWMRHSPLCLSASARVRHRCRPGQPVAGASSRVGLLR
jgi:hypothetical protein